MAKLNTLEELVQQGKGVLQTSVARKAGITKRELAKFVKVNKYERAAHGIYVAPDAWIDDTYLVQIRCPGVIFSHDSALYCHDLTDREPLQITATAKAGYNPTHLTSQGIKVYTIKSELYSVGITTSETPFGHQVKVYNIERTICDVLRSRHSMETQVFQNALKAYVKRSDKNLQQLTEYSRLFRVEKLVDQYMGVLL